MEFPLEKNNFTLIKKTIQKKESLFVLLKIFI